MWSYSACSTCRGKVLFLRGLPLHNAQRPWHGGFWQEMLQTRHLGGYSAHHASHVFLFILTVAHVPWAISEAFLSSRRSLAQCRFVAQWLFCLFVWFGFISPSMWRVLLSMKSVQLCTAAGNEGQWMTPYSPTENGHYSMWLGLWSMIVVEEIDDNLALPGSASTLTSVVCFIASWDMQRANVIVFVLKRKARFDLCSCKAALALTHDMHGILLPDRYIPRWSSGQDFALSPRRPGFDSPSGKILFWKKKSRWNKRYV